MVKTVCFNLSQGVCMQELHPMEKQICKVHLDVELECKTVYDWWQLKTLDFKTKPL